MDPIQLANIRRIQEASKRGRLVIFAGAGVSANSGVPMWGRLIAEMKKELPGTFSYETDELKVAQMYKDSRGDKEYFEKVKEILCYNKVISNDIHKAILALNPEHIITTNYDDLIEQEIQNECKQYAIVRSDKDLPNMAYPNLLIKMHGDFLNCNIVLTENDYYNYSKNFALIRAYVQSLFASKLVVFIGFSFADLNLKMILNEVKNILEERMQPVYLISLEKPNEIVKKYFENKGINIVYLNDVQISELKDSIWKFPNPSRSLNEFGHRLYNILTIIKRYDFDDTDDLISYVYSKVSRYKDEIRVYGSGLKYLLPHNLEKNHFNEHSNGLQTFLKYFDNLDEELKTFSGRKAFVKKHGIERCREYVQFAYYNYLNNIDRLHVLGESFRHHAHKYIPQREVDEALEEFNFSGFNYRLRTLSSRKIAGTLEDLEYPYAFYRIGKYFQAYQEFNKILSVAWRRQKYILYLICLYNMWSLRYAIHAEMTFGNPDKTIDWQPVYDKLCEIDLNETLEKLPLPKEIRNIFQDVLSNRYIGSRAVESEDLKEKLHQQRKMAERGGFSMNSNIQSLIGKYRRERQFSHHNFILSDFNQYYTAICRNTICGILNSFATKDEEESEFWGNTRIESIDNQQLSVMVWGLDNKELREIFKQYEVYQLDLDETGITFLLSCINNLSREGIPYPSHKILNAVKNLLYIIGRCPNLEVDINNLYTVILMLWRLDVQRFEMKAFVDLIVKAHNPSPEIALSFLEEILEKNESHDYYELITTLSNVIESSELKLSNIERYLTDNIHDFYLLPLYSLLKEEDRGKLIEFAQNRFNKFFAKYIEFLYHTNSLPISLEELERREKEDSNRIEGNKAVACKFIAEWRKNEAYSSLWEWIDDYAKRDECMRFFLNPMEYDVPENVPIVWLRICDKEQVRELVKNNLYADKIIEWSSRPRISPEARKEFLSVFKRDEKS